MLVYLKSHHWCNTYFNGFWATIGHCADAKNNMKHSSRAIWLENPINYFEDLDLMSSLSKTNILSQNCFLNKQHVVTEV